MITIPAERQPLIQTFLERNSRLNLSAIRDAEGVYTKHILDSIELDNVLTLASGATLLDVGTGGWFPLLPLASKYPEVLCTGIDARRKKIDAVNAIIQEVGIQNAKALRWRIEEHRQKYDYVTARAVAYSDILVPELIKVTKPWGNIILYKLFTEEEHRSIRDLCRRYHVQLQHEHYYILPSDPHTTQRMLYIFKNTDS